MLASGDPFFYGVGSVLAHHVVPDETLVVPAPSSFSLAAARLGWALPEIALVSLHGRALDRIRPHLHPGARVLALTSDGEGPEALARLLAETGFGESRLTVLEALGGAARAHPHDALPPASTSPTSPSSTSSRSRSRQRPARAVIAYAPGLADDLFEHDGQITKREIRAVTLSSLAPRRGELLWDIGAGSGSVAIEWMLAHPSLRAVAIEARADRAARIRRNAAAFGVPELEVVEGQAPEALAGLAAPDAVFIGGGASEPGVLDAAIAALQPGGRLVANAVTLETEARADRAPRRARRRRSRASPSSRADSVGGKTGWRPAMPVTQWVWIKP